MFLVKDVLRLESRSKRGVMVCVMGDGGLLVGEGV